LGEEREQWFGKEQGTWAIYIMVGGRARKNVAMVVGGTRNMGNIMVGGRTRNKVAIVVGGARNRVQICNGWWTSKEQGGNG
jgi:hypothetical protein